jgi:two-component system, NarL family, response regulator
MQMFESLHHEVRPAPVYVPAQRKVRLLIVDPQPVVCEGLSSIVRRSPMIELVGVCWSGDAALRFVSRTTVDLVVLDSRMTPMSGMELLWQLHRNSISCKALVLSSSEVEEEIFESMEAGAAGYLHKNTSPAEILRAILAVAAGKRIFPAASVTQFETWRPHRSLTARELEVLNLVSKGLSNKEVGRVLGLSQFTVRNQMKRICTKLDASDRTEAATTAMQRGMIRQ